MTALETKVKYGENLVWRGRVAMSGRSVTQLAKAIGVSRQTLSETINGHYKGANVIPKLEQELNK